MAKVLWPVAGAACRNQESLWLKVPQQQHWLCNGHVERSAPVGRASRLCRSDGLHALSPVLSFCPDVLPALQQLLQPQPAQPVFLLCHHACGFTVQAITDTADQGGIQVPLTPGQTPQAAPQLLHGNGQRYPSTFPPGYRFSSVAAVIPD